jgi:N utilization substance protein B
MGHRRKAREVALQILYQIDISKTNAKEAIDLFWMSFDNPENVREFSTQLILGVTDNIETIDKLINECSENWSLRRMAKVDKNILRMAVYELLYCKNIPPKATLNEAIDLGKYYGSENSSSFINGILDALYAKLRESDEDRNIVGVDRCAE